MLTRSKALPFVLSLLIILEACAPTLPLSKKSTLSLPSDFQEDSLSSDKEAQLSAEATWNEFFHDPQLSLLIETALKNNQELQIIEQEINIANNEILARQGEYLPRVGIGASGGVEKAERFTDKELNAPIPFTRSGAFASWEVDIWGRLRSATKAAYLSYLSSVEGQRFMVTNLVSEIATTYFELLALDNQLEIIKNYIDLLKRIRTFADLQLQAGRSTSLPVKRFEAEIQKNQGRRFEIEQRTVVLENKLNTLVGRFPQKIKRKPDEFMSLTLSRVKSSVPLKLLDNRPDVKRAALQLEASKISVDVAKKRFYPSLSVEANAGYETFNTKHLAEPYGTFFGVAANLTAPLLNRRAIKAEYFSANNRQIQAVYEYEQTLIKAYTEVVNELNMIKNYNLVYESKLQQVKALNDSIEISNVLFKAARVDYIEALLTQRDALDAQIELFEIKKQQLGAYVNLYRALGGGWRGKDEKKS